jgi:antitoxin component YwqK of YwqJK toxin-antitoxin module
METTQLPIKEVITYYPNGKVQLNYSIIKNQNGINYHGPYKQYDEDGNLVIEAEFFLGVRNNNYLIYEKGKLIIEAKYFKGKELKYIIHNKQTFN